MYQALLVAVLALLVASGVALNSVNKRLEASVAAHAMCTTRLLSAEDKIQAQNLKIEEIRRIAEEEKAEADTRVEVIYRDLPVLIERDISSPATADSLNQWMRNVL